MDLLWPGGLCWREWRGPSTSLSTGPPGSECPEVRLSADLTLRSLRLTSSSSGSVVMAFSWRKEGIVVDVCYS